MTVPWSTGGRACWAARKRASSWKNSGRLWFLLACDSKAPSTMQTRFNSSGRVFDSREFDRKAKLRTENRSQFRPFDVNRSMIGLAFLLLPCTFTVFLMLTVTAGAAFRISAKDLSKAARLACHTRHQIEVMFRRAKWCIQQVCSRRRLSLESHGRPGRNSSWVSASSRGWQGPRE